MIATQKIYKLLSVLLCIVMVIGLIPNTGTVYGETSIDVKDGLTTLTATSLPASFDYELGSEDILYKNSNDDYVYAKRLRVDIQEDNTLLDIKFSGKGEDVDTVVELYGEDEGISLIKRQDSDNLNGSGQHSMYLLEAGTYYVALLGYSTGSTGLCHAEISAVSMQNVGSLDFTTEPVPVPEEVDKWSWNAETKTLTLKDGFTICNDEDSAVILPDGATVFVEGEAEITVPDYNYGIYVEGSFTIKGNGEENSILKFYSVYNDVINGNVHVENCSMMYNGLKGMDMVDGLKALDTVTPLPASFDYELGSEPILYDGVYAKLIKIDINEANTFLRARFEGKYQYVDTYLYLFKEDGENITEVYSTDSDNFEYSLTEAGTYYVALAGSSDDDIGLCHAEIYAFSTQDARSLDFTTEPVPVPEEGDKWSWDAQTKTLTLKDGFSIVSVDEDAINLPDDATVVIEGKTSIYSPGYDGIYGEGALNIKGDGEENSLLTIYAGDDGVDIDGEILIEDCSLKIESEYRGVYVYGVTVRRAALYISSEDEGIYITSNNGNVGNVTITDSDVKITSEEDDGIYSRGNVTITDSDVKITSEEDDGIYSRGNATITDSDVNIISYYEGIDVDGNITVSGGRLVINARRDSFEANSVSLTDVVFNLKTKRSSNSLFDMDSAEGFSLPGEFFLYDIYGNELYKGEWKTEFLNGTELYVGDTKVFSAVSVHNHSWSEEWESNETHHWHQCNTAYCDVTDNEQKDGYAPHEPKVINAVEATETAQGYTGDTVCKVCGYEMAEGTVIPAINHTHRLTLVPEKEATETQAGNKAYYICDGCDKWFADAAGTVEIINKNSVIIPAGNEQSPQTGDNSIVSLWIGILLISVCGVYKTAGYGRKKKYSAK